MGRKGKAVKAVVVGAVLLMLCAWTVQGAFADLGDLRGELVVYYRELAAVWRDFPHADEAGSAERARMAAKQVVELSEEDLALLHRALSAAPKWPLIPQILRFALELGAESRWGASLGEGAPPPDCPGGLPNGILDWFIARDVAQGLEFAQVFAPDDLVVVTVVAGSGGGGTISTHPVKLALQIAYESAQTAALVLEQIYFINDECESNAHQELLRLVDDKVDELTRKVDEVLAREIEENLAVCRSLVSLYLPAQNGGRLETLAELLEGWIEQSEMAGLRSGQARRFYKQGMVDMLNGAYKEAYGNFCKAYTHLADPGPRYLGGEIESVGGDAREARKSN